MEIRWLIFYVIEPFKSGSTLNYQIQLFSPSSKQAQTNSLFDERLHGKIVLFVDSPKAYVNNEVVQLDSGNENVVPLIKNERILVPIRFISENLGGEVSWKPERESIVIIHADNYIELTIGDKFMGINGMAKELDTSPEMISGRVYLPLRAVAEALSKQVFWENGLIIISEHKFEKEGNEDLISSLIALLKVEKPVVQKASRSKTSRSKTAATQRSISCHVGNQRTRDCASKWRVRVLQRWICFREWAL
ncbi:copper amine oxidase-like protein [Thermolongibacillus altinsuensis]|uniref:Copper amine oxidase-like protein n=1 Tax=Thermolongibacillus altinsuensis TaxID=575256 RepID=A0A4R1QJU9_9BACL|nr:copper amine oxidase N-terminal domain-containing protein [Thermolongibacillus altinsuensis]TCL46827.1 copper amine oxidase-like protein [Thermolongibacillus altinsuensis]